MTEESIKLLIVSPDRALAGALAAMTADDPTFEVVAHAADLTEFKELAGGWQPTVVAISLAVPGSLEAISNLSPSTAALALDDQENPERMLDCLESGANGYAITTMGLDNLLQAIRTIARGTASIPPTLLSHLLRSVVLRRRAERSALELLDLLTVREREVFELAARGLGQGEMADELYISPGTVRTHLQRVFGKLDVHSRAELVALAAQCGLDVGIIDQEPE